MAHAHPLQAVFDYCPRCGQSGLERQGTNGLVCRICGFTYYLNPAVAVMGVVVDPHHRILLIERARDPGKGLLAFPGGFVEAWETAEAALAREMEEEAGVLIADIRYLCSEINEYVFRGLVYPVLDLCYTAQYAERKGEIDREEVRNVVWQQRNSLSPERLAFPSMRRAWSQFLRLNHPPQIQP